MTVLMPADTGVTAPPKTSTWGICGSCRLERRVVDGRMSDHRVWNPTGRIMYYCPGGRQPVTATVES